VFSLGAVRFGPEAGGAKVRNEGGGCGSFLGEGCTRFCIKLGGNGRLPGEGGEGFGVVSVAVGGLCAMAFAAATNSGAAKAA
jgi:hypothetical protein